MVFLFTVGLVAGATIAWADEDTTDEPSEDTLLNFAYDMVNHVFLVNTSATDFTYDCTLENGTLTAQYGAGVDGRIPVDMLLDAALQPFLFPNRPAEQVGTDFTVADDPVAYSGADGECGISGGVVGGPNGQINHGQFMKLFHQLVDMRGRGCLNRVIARSQLGKGEQQLRTADVDPTFQAGASGVVDFTTVAADCNHHRNAGSDDQQTANLKKNKNNHGRPDSPGNSGNAPGHQK